MSTFRNPVGPQPSKTYWRRRLVVGLGIVAVIVIVILILVKPGPHKVGAPPHTSASSSVPASNSSTVTACNPASVSVLAVTDATTYAATVTPQLSLTVTNNGATACTFKDGSDLQAYTITSGNETIWSSKDCQKDATPATTTLQPGKPVSSTPFPWDRTRSSKSTCASTTLPKVTAGGASYHLSVTVNGVTSTKTKQFILQ
jgi:hypothetical protein